MTREEFAVEAMKGLLMAEASEGPLGRLQQTGPPAKGQKFGDAALVERAFQIADEMVKQSASAQYPYGVVNPVSPTTAICPACGAAAGRWEHDPVGWLECPKCSWKHHP